MLTTKNSVSICHCSGDPPYSFHLPSPCPSGHRYSVLCLYVFILDLFMLNNFCLFSIRVKSHCTCLFQSDLSILHYRSDQSASDFVQRSFEFFSDILQLFADFDVLRAVLFAFAAADAVGGGAAVLSEGGAHEIVFHAADKAVAVLSVISSK